MDLIRIVGNPWIFGVVAAFVLTLGLVSLSLIHRARRVRNALTGTAETIRGLNPIRDDLLAQIAGALPGDLSSLKEQWEEFSEGIVMVAGRRRNTYPIAHFFVEESITGSIKLSFFPYHFLQLAPTICTGMGMLGTFMGIALALGGIDFTVDVTESVKAVLPALSSAFTTSIIGVFTAMLIEFFANGSVTKLDAALYGLREAIDRKIERITTEELVNQLASDMGRHGQVLRGSVKQIQDLLHTGVGGSSLASLEYKLQEIGAHHARSTQTTGAIHEVLKDIHRSAQVDADAQERMVAILTKLEISTSETRDTINQVADRVLDHLDTAFDRSLKNVLAPYLQQLVKIVDKQVTAASDQATNQVRRFADEFVNEVKRSVTNSFDALGTRLETASSQLATAGADLHAVVQGATETVKNQNQVLERGRAVVASALAQAERSSLRLAETEQMAGVLGNLTSALQAQQDQLLETQLKQAETQRNLEDQMAKVVAIVRSHREQEDQARSAMQQVAATMGGMLKRSESSLGDVLERLTEQLGKLETNVNATQVRTGAGVDTLDRVVQSLNQRLDAEAALLDGYQVAARGFGEAFSAGRPTMTALEAAASDLRRQQAAVLALAERLEMASRATQTAAQAMDSGLSNAARQMAQAGQGFQQVVQSTTDWAEATTQGIERFGAGLTQAIENSLTRYDESLATAVQSFVASIKDLEDVAEQLSELASRFGARR